MLINKIRNHRIISKLRTHKRATTISLFSLLFLAVAIGGYFLSQRIWNDYEISYNQRFDSAKSDIDKAIQSDSADKLTNIIQVQTDLTEAIKSYCEVNSLIKWQTIISQYSDKIKVCEQKKERFSGFLVDLSELTSYLKAEQQLAVIITLAKTKTEESNQADKWAEIEAFWRQAITDASKLPDTDQFASIKTLSVTNLTKMADAWQKLSSANLAEDRQQYEESHTNLDQMYPLLAEISTSSELQVKSLITDVNSSYEEL